MASVKQIIIKKEYFDNIKTAIDSLNEFFSSNFKKKDFPVIDSDYQLDGTILNILSWLNNVEPSWLEDSSRIEGVVESIHNATEEIDGDIYENLVSNNKTVVLDHINTLVGFKVLQFIADNFNEFSEFINGIYSFELFTKPSKYRDVIDKFGQTINLEEIVDVMGDATYTLYDSTKYVTAIFNNEQIKLPSTMKLDAEIERMNNFVDLEGVEILVDETVQEAAKVNYFEDVAPEHIKYDEKKNKWLISKQFEKSVNDLVAELQKCDTTEDLVNMFDNSKPKIPEPDSFTTVVIPCILTRVYSNPKKYQNENYDKELMDNYTKSYDSIIEQNNGAKRFAKYDIFSTFKTDKEGTIKFIEDFLKLNLVNDETCVISNNTLLTIFNIFDSRIYLDILYNVLPEDIQKKYNNENEFVKTIRARINKNSHSANVYQKDNKASEGNEVPTTEKLQEYVVNSLKEFGDMSIADIQYCEHFHSLINDEINCLGDIMYNQGISQISIDNYIGESYDVFGKGIFQEQEQGDIPDYMRTRINLSDESGNNPQVTTTDVQLPPDVPANPVEDLVSSIDAKLNAGGDIDDMLGSGYEGNPNKNNREGKVVVNITNNYTNSFNKDSNNTSSNISNDLSTGKKTVSNTTNTNSHNDSSHNKTTNTDASRRKFADTNSNNNKSSSNNPEKVSNNYNNSSDSVDTKDSSSTKRDGNQTLSSGLTLQEMFLFLESEEPLSDGKGAGKPPKGDTLTAAMDADRKTLSWQQNAKRKVQKVINTGKAALKPVTRVKQWLTHVVDTLIKRDEDRVKAEIIENPSYRTTLYKAMRLAIKFGLVGVAFTISGFLGTATLVTLGARAADKDRLKKEVQEEFVTELKILDDKIEKADQAKDYDAKYKMMRLRSKMQNMVLDAPRSVIRHPRSVI